LKLVKSCIAFVEGKYIDDAQGNGVRKPSPFTLFNDVTGEAGCFIFGVIRDARGRFGQRKLIGAAFFAAHGRSFKLQPVDATRRKNFGASGMAPFGTMRAWSREYCGNETGRETELLIYGNPLITSCT
jgi:hypothetical protein